MHVSVLLDEALELLEVRDGGRYIDGTAGMGGHLRALLSRVGAEGRVLGVDRDPEALRLCRERLDEQDGRWALAHGNYGEMERLATEAGMMGVDGVLLDLGVSSYQLDTPDRGFSFQHGGPLDMRMDRSRPGMASELLQELSESELADVIFELGEERRSRRIAAAIMRHQKAHGPIESTDELARIVESAVGGRQGRRHPATQTFQALRMAVNSELDWLSEGLSASLAVLRPGGRLAVIAFHSLEDRQVKRFFRAHEGRDVALAAGGSQWQGERPRCRRVNRRVVKSSDEETGRNPRARSARLRVLERAE